MQPVEALPPFEVEEDVGLTDKLRLASHAMSEAFQAAQTCLPRQA